ncbi:MAG TPA: OmpA family protein [Saprospiraceae bacterium]|nr:OmpA family protein [Saprospiraceae bacterium]
MRRYSFFFLFIFYVARAANAQSLFDSIRVVHSVEIYFASGEASLSEQAVATLDSLAAYFHDTKDATGIRITAHTDSVGNFEQNMALSKKRARSVGKNLESKGIDPARMVTVYWGEKRPAAANATEDGRQRNRRATIDVFVQIPMTDLSGRIVDQKTGQGIQTMLNFSYQTYADSMLTDTAGRYKVRLPQDIPVKVDAFAKGYFFEGILRYTRGPLTSPDKIRKDKEKEEIRLQPALPGEVLVLKNLYFVGNSDQLLDNSKPTLPKILKFLQLNLDLKVEIAGHINVPFAEKGKEVYTQQNTSAWEMSEARAQTVYNYLIDNGLPARRLSWKGYGNSQMLKPYARTEADQQLNRRVEIRVLEKIKTDSSPSD